MSEDKNVQARKVVESLSWLAQPENARYFQSMIKQDQSILTEVNITDASQHLTKISQGEDF